MRRNQLDLGSVRELHVSIAQPVRVRPAGFQDEAESFEVRLRCIQVRHGQRNVIQASDNRFRHRRGSHGRSQCKEED